MSGDGAGDKILKLTLAFQQNDLDSNPNSDCVILSESHNLSDAWFPPPLNDDYNKSLF